MSAPLLFLAADPREFAGLLPHWTSLAPKNLAVHWARTAMWRGRPVMAIANGAGANRAFVAVLLAHEISAVCNIGFCGALDEKLRIGDVVVGTSVDDGTEVHPAADPRGPQSAATGVVATISRIAATAAEKRALREKGATIVEMEAAGAAKGAQDLGVPFYCVRAVSDLAGESFANNFNAALGGDGRFSLFRLVTGALASPSTRFRELIELRKRTELASKKLGDFLVNCKF
jgi:adenosylhomocysteine nucleosidase